MEHTLDIFLAPDKSGAFELFLRTQTGKAYIEALKAEVREAEKAKVAEAEAIAEAKTREAERAELEKAKAEAKAAQAQLRLENQVLRMFANNEPMDKIVLYTGLSIDEINTILGK